MKSLKNVYIFDSAILLVITCPKDIIRDVHKNVCTMILINRLFVIEKNWKQLTCPRIRDWLNYFNTSIAWDTI